MSGEEAEASGEAEAIEVMKKLSKRERRKEKRQERKAWRGDYKQYYGEAPPYDLEGYKTLGHRQLIGEIIVYTLFLAFFGWGAYNLYYLGGVVRGYIDTSNVIEWSISNIGAYQYLIEEYYWQVILLIIGIYLVSFTVSYLVVRFFADMAWFFMYGSLVIQITLSAILYWKINDWEYSWIFIAITIPNILMLTFWHKKFKKAIKFLKLSCFAVWKEKKLLLPQLTQTIWIFFFSLFYTVVSMGYVLEVTPIQDWNLSFNDQQYTITRGWIYFAYTCLFVILCYIVYFVSNGMKQQMIHYWYRGDKIRFRRSYRIMRYRWWGVLGFAASTTIIHMLQYIKKAIKGEFAPKSLKDALKMADTMKPEDIQMLTKKKATIFERIWMGLNYFTLHAIVLENKRFVPGIWRSFRMVYRNTADLYIKKSHVNLIFRFMKIMMTITSGLVGGFMGGVAFYYLFGYDTLYWDVENWQWGVAFFLPIFLYVGGGVSTIILNDLNTSYKTIMYIHSVDELNNKKGYTRYELKNPLSNKEMQAMQEREQKKVETQKQKELDKLKKKEEKKQKRRNKRKKRKSKSEEPVITEDPTIE